MINHSRKKFFILIPIALLLVVPIIILFLWNWIVVDLFGVKSIGYLQALGLFVLSRILFGSYGFRGKPRHPFSPHPIFYRSIIANYSSSQVHFYTIWYG